VGISVVIFSTLLGFSLKNINEILVIVTGAFYASYMASNILKWYWWRFNGNGYFWGMLTGIMSGLVVGYLQLFSPETVTSTFTFIPSELISLYLFPITLVISLIGCIAGTLLSEPTDEATLVQFYSNVRPWGFWQPVYEKVKAQNPDFHKNTRFWKDMRNVAVGIVTQLSLVAMPIYLVTGNWAGFFIALALIAAGTIILKYTWWNKLNEI
jgi:hypothetical protein